MTQGRGEREQAMPRAKGPKQPVTISVPEIITRERAMYLDRLAGKSVRAIAEAFGISPTEAQAVISSQCAPVTTQLKLHTVELELARLDELASVWHPKALAGCAQAAALVLKIQERRSCLLGTDTPLKIDAVQVRAAAMPQQPSSVDRIMEAIRRIAGKPELNDSDLPEEPSPPADGGDKRH
jgi:hypothetical protein